MSNDEVDKLKLHNDEVDRQKSLRENKRTGIQKRKLIDTPFVKLSYQKIYSFWYYVVNDEVSSTFSQIVEQVEAIQEVVLLGRSKLND